MPGQLPSLRSAATPLADIRPTRGESLESAVARHKGIELGSLLASSTFCKVYRGRRPMPSGGRGHYTARTERHRVAQPWMGPCRPPPHLPPSSYTLHCISSFSVHGASITSGTTVRMRSRGASPGAGCLQGAGAARQWW